VQCKKKEQNAKKSQKVLCQKILPQENACRIRI